MSSEDHSFCREERRQVMILVKEKFSQVMINKAWVHMHRGSVNASAEFHGPNGEYFYFRAHCRADAEAKGWGKLLDSLLPPDKQVEDRKV